MPGRTVPDDGNRARKRRLELEEAVKLHEAGRIKLLEPPQRGVETSVEVDGVHKHSVTASTADALRAAGAPIKGQS